MPVALDYIGAGLKDGKVKTASGDVYDIFAIIEATGESQQDEIEVKGDDELLGTFVSNKREELSIVANGISFDVLQAITGNNYASSATGIEIPLGTESEMNPPEVELQGFTNAIDSANVACTIKKVWHKVTIKSIKVSQAGEKEFNVEMTGVAYTTASDIEGNALATKRVATLYVTQNA